MQFLRALCSCLCLSLSLQGVVSIQFEAGTANKSLEALRVRARASYEVIQDIHKGKSFLLGEVNGAINSIATYTGTLAASHGLPVSVKPFLIISQEHSGSGFICSMLDSHPDLMCALGEPDRPGTHSASELSQGSLEEAFERAMTKVIQKIQSEVIAAHVKWFGITLAASQVVGVQDGIAQIDASVIFHFRRNALRQIISEVASEKNTTTQGSHAKLAGKADFKPSVHSFSMQCMIVNTIKERHDVMELVTNSGANVCAISHYEDWLKPETLAVIERNIFDCFGVEPAPLSANTIGVHTQVSALETVANAADLLRVMYGGPFSYMLEFNRSSEEIFEGLKVTDQYELAPPECWRPYEK